MSRQLTAATTLENLKREAKRWLKALRENDPEARQRWERAYPNSTPQPILRRVQHALALEFGMESWIALVAALQAPPAPVESPQASPAARFLEYACPDHHVRGRPAHRMATHAAMRVLAGHPEITRQDLYTAVVCGEYEEVERILNAHPELANAKHAAGGAPRSGSGGSYDFLGDLGAKDWEPLLYLCFTRLPLARANDNAVEIARLLLDRGADPNAYFMAGDSRYTPLTGVIGEGEEDRPPHSRRDELARLLLERGAEPYDGQVIYNIHFHGRMLWWVKLMHEFSLKAGRAADWDDPEWHMLDQGGYGSGARWHLREAVKHNDLELAEWCLSHGANPNAAPETDPRFPQYSLYEHAIRLGHTEVAELLARNGAVRTEVAFDAEEQYVAACLRLDREAVQSALTAHPEFLQSTKAIFAAAEANRADVVVYLLDLGTPIEVENDRKQRPLHAAAWSDAVDVARLLIERGAEIDPYELEHTNTPFDFAVYWELPRMIEVLTPHSKDVWNLTRTGAVERLRQVLSAEPPLARTSWQTTPLFGLPEDEQQAIAIVRLFLEHGADAGFRGKDGTTAADWARRRGMREVAAVLDQAATLARPRTATAQAYAQAAQDFVAAYEGDTQALERFNQHYDRVLTLQDLKAMIWRRVYAFRQRSSRVPKNFLKLEEAQIVVAQDEGFGSWTKLIEAAETGQAAQGAPYVIDPKEKRIAPSRYMRPDDWDEMLGVLAEQRLPAVESHGMLTDPIMARIASLEHVTRITLGGSSELTDQGLMQLARMPQLEYLNLSAYPGDNLTDQGLEVLRHLPNLRTFEMTWQRGISDVGIANLRYCPKLERVDLMGSPTGDGVIEALQGMEHLRNFQTGRLVTDAGLPMLHNFPLLKQWRPDEGGKGSRLLIDGPFTDAGLAGLAGLEGVFELDLFWHVTGITPAGFASLPGMPNLSMLGCDGELSGDEAMPHIAAIPRLKRLRIQESAATDAGFEALSKSQSIAHIWGRECPHFGSRGFIALSRMPALQNIGIGCKNVDDAALAALPRFPSLRELTPIGFSDAGFRHIGGCRQLERLTCMYCRETGDEATAHIVGLPLKYYYAGLTQITNRSLELLGRIHSLEEIEFYECNGPTDAGLPHLATLPNLKEVHIDGLPGVTLNGTKVFPPGVRVYYST